MIKKKQIIVSLSIFILIFSSSCQNTSSVNTLVPSDKTHSVSDAPLASGQATQVPSETNIPRPPTRTPTPFPMDLEGKLSLQTDGQLYILDFDRHRLEEIQIRGMGHFNTAIWSHDGTKILDVPSSENYRNLYVYNIKTGEKTLIVYYEDQEIHFGGVYPSFSWSPDDEQIAFVSFRDGNSEIYIVNLEDNKITNITNNPTADESPNWSPDGEKIAFISDRSGSLHIYVMNADGSRLRRITPSGFPEMKESIWPPFYLRKPTWSPDGKKLAFMAAVENDQWELFVIDPDGSNLIQLTQSDDEFSFSFGNDIVWSPDSTKLVFSACAGLPGIGNIEIYTVDVYTQEITRMTFDDEDNINYDYHPLWVNDGNVILFISGRLSGKTEKDRLFAIDLLNNNQVIHLYDFPFDIVYFAEVLP